MMTDAFDRTLHRQHRPPKILVAEDEVLLRLAVADQLRAAGFSVAEAASAREALALLRSNDEIRLVFSDVNMAGPLDGLHLLGEVRRHYPDIPVILTSGVIAHAANASAGAAPFIPKPYDLHAVVSLVRSAIADKGAQDE